MKTGKYEVVVTVWSDEYRKQIQKVAGSFDEYMNARLFADAYSRYYSSDTKIVEYKKVEEIYIDIVTYPV